MRGDIMVIPNFNSFYKWFSCNFWKISKKTLTFFHIGKVSGFWDQCYISIFGLNLNIPALRLGWRDLPTKKKKKTCHEKTQPGQWLCCSKAELKTCSSDSGDLFLTVKVPIPRALDFGSLWQLQQPQRIFIVSLSDSRAGSEDVSDESFSTISIAQTTG